MKIIFDFVYIVKVCASNIVSYHW